MNSGLDSHTVALKKPIPIGVQIFDVTGYVEDYGQIMSIFYVRPDECQPEQALVEGMPYLYETGTVE